MRVNQRILILCIIFLFLFGYGLFSNAQENIPRVVREVKQSVVTIQTYDEDGNLNSTGSGFFINKAGDVITNRHVLQIASKAEIITANGESYQITHILGEEKTSDIIRVSTDAPLNVVHPVSISTSSCEVGELVIVIGSPLGLEQSVSDGIVSAVRIIPEYGKVIQITAPISEGSSGSPVVDRLGKVIGIATFQLAEGQNLNFAIPIERAINLNLDKRLELAEWLSIISKELQARAYDLLSLATKAELAENYDLAISYYEKALKIAPNYLKIYYYLGYTHQRVGNDHKAIETYNKALKIDPNYADIYYGLGTVYHGQGKYNLAIDSYKKAIKINPKDESCYFSLFLSYGALGKTGESIEALKGAIRAKPEWDLAHYWLGFAYLAIGDKVSAINEYKILKNLKSELADTLFELIYK